MSPEKLAAVHSRAQAVVDGLARVREQQARDVLSCTAYIASLEHGQEVLKKRLLELSPKKVPEGTSFTEAFDDIFGDIFGVKK